MPYVVLILLWGAWCFLHSLMIAPSVTGYVQKHFTGIRAHYRIIYNVIALLTLIPVLLYSISLKGTPVFLWNGTLRIVQVLLLILSLSLFIAGARQYDMARFLGLGRVRKHDDCAVLSDNCQLNTNGILGMVRHPWYTGGVLIVWARDLDMATLVTSTLITGYFFIGAALEERKLLAEFGDAYVDYQRRVSMFIPYKWIKNKFT